VASTEHWLAASSRAEGGQQCDGPARDWAIFWGEQLKRAAESGERKAESGSKELAAAGWAAVHERQANLDQSMGPL